MADEKKAVKETKEVSKGSKFVNFFKNLPQNIATPFKNMWHELKKVTWPTKQDLIKYSCIVLLFMVFMGIVIGLLDMGASRLVTAVSSLKGTDEQIIIDTSSTDATVEEAADAVEEAAEDAAEAAEEAAETVEEAATEAVEAAEEAAETVEEAATEAVETVEEAAAEVVEAAEEAATEAVEAAEEAATEAVETVEEAAEQAPAEGN